MYRVGAYTIVLHVHVRSYINQIWSFYAVIIYQKSVMQVVGSTCVL